MKTGSIAINYKFFLGPILFNAQGEMQEDCQGAIKNLFMLGCRVRPIT